MFLYQRNEELKNLNKIAIPLIIQNIAGMSIGMIDEMFLGRISAQSYGAIGIVVSTMSFLAGIFGYIAVSFNILGSKINAKKDSASFKDMLMSSILVDIIIGTIYGLLIILLGKFVFGVFYGLSNEALNTAVTYSRIAAPYMLLQMIIFTCNSYYKIMKKTRNLMLFSVGASVMNVVLDYLLIFGKFVFPKLGAKGAAIASMISILANAMLLVVTMRRDLVFSFKKTKLYLDRIKDLFATSLPLVGEELWEGTIFILLINAIISHYGIIEISGYLLVKNLLNIILISMYMYGSAALTLVSEKIGQKAYGKIIEIAKTASVISTVIFLVLGIMMAVFRNYVPMIISDKKELIVYSSKIIIPMILFNLLNPVQTIYKYVLQACEDGKFVFYATASINVLALIIILGLGMFELRLTAIFVGLFSYDDYL